MTRLDEIDIVRLGMPGDAVDNTLHVAAETGAHLIAVPNFGDPGPVRAFLPNQVDALLSAAQCSVLVVPDRAAFQTIDGLGHT